MPIAIGVHDDEVASVPEFVQEGHFGHGLAVHHHAVEGKDDGKSVGLFVAIARGRKVDRELAGLAVVEEHMPDLATRSGRDWSSSSRSSSDGARVLTEADQG